MKTKGIKVTFYSVYRTMEQLIRCEHPVKKVKAYFHDDKVILKDDKGKRTVHHRSVLKSTNTKGIRKFQTGSLVWYLCEYKSVMWTPNK